MVKENKTLEQPKKIDATELVKKVIKDYEGVVDYLANK